MESKLLPRQKSPWRSRTNILLWTYGWRDQDKSGVIWYEFCDLFVLSLFSASGNIAHFRFDLKTPKEANSRACFNELSLLLASIWLAFAVIENLLYQLRPEVRENPDIMQWRWTVCVVLHVTCCLISSLGLMRTWNLSMTRNEKPNMATSAVFIMAAAILHGLYNLGCILFELKEKIF